MYEKNQKKKQPIVSLNDLTFMNTTGDMRLYRIVLVGYIWKLGELRLLMITSGTWIFIVMRKQKKYSKACKLQIKVTVVIQYHHS
jgi:hypothetical protein